MFQKSLSLMVAGILFAIPSLAKTTEMQSFPAVEQVLADDDRIVVRGFKGSVSFSGTGGGALKVEGLRPKSKNPYDQWSVTLKKQGKDAVIAVKGPSELEDWAKIGEGKVPTFSLKISGPPRKVFVSWQEGSVDFKNWQQDVTVNTTKSSITTSGTKGALNLQSLNGTIKVAEHEGTMNLQARTGSMSVTNGSGPLTVSNLSASVRLLGHKGPVDLQTYRGGFSSQDGEGDIVFDSAAGALVVTGHTGSLRGVSKSGAISVKGKVIQDFNVTTDSGSVTLDLPKSAGAYVSIRSERGKLRGAPNFAKVRKGRWTELKGKLKGKDQGQVKIVSKYGDIVVK